MTGLGDAGDLRRALAGLLAWAFLGAAASAAAAEDADNLYRAGRFAEAFEAYSLSGMDHPKDLRYRFNRGCAAYQNEDYPGAQAAFASVLARAEEEDVRFRALFNLGNVAFKQDSFAAAADLYRRVIVMRPEREAPRRNLELALRELAKQKQEEQQDQPPEDSQHDEEQQQQDGGQNQPAEQHPPSEDGQPSSEEQEPKSEPGGEPTATPEERPSPPAEQPEAVPQEEPEAVPPAEGQSGEDGPAEERPLQALVGMDQKKAEALLDNIQEDPARMLQFRIPEEDRHPPASGRDW